MTDALENLFQIVGKNYENFVSFTNRMRWEFESDDMAEKIESDIVLPEVPASCSPATLAARDSLKTVKEETDDCLSYLEWLNKKLTDECDALTASFEALRSASPHAKTMAQVRMDTTEELISQLYELLGEEVGAASLELFEDTLV